MAAKYIIKGVCDFRLDYLLRKIKAASNQVIVHEVHGEKVIAECDGFSCERFKSCTQRSKMPRYSKYHPKYNTKGYSITLTAF